MGVVAKGLRRDGALDVVGCYPGTAAGGTPLWRYRIPCEPLRDLVGECAGRTKSEARADAKCRLGLARRRGRLPVGTFLYRTA